MQPPCDTVLVVDDHQDALDGLAVILRRDGYTVETALNGRDALVKLYQGLRPCLIVLDLTMPVMSGFEFRQKQLADRDIADIPLIAFSSVTDPAKAQQLRAAAYVHKPSDPSQLAALVRQLCPKAAPG